jgi:hypothetical protein
LTVKLRYKNFARGCNLKKFFNTTKGIFFAEEKFEKNNKREMMKARFHTKPHIFIKELKRKVWKLEDKFHVCFFFQFRTGKANVIQKLHNRKSLAYSVILVSIF